MTDLRTLLNANAVTPRRELDVDAVLTRARRVGLRRRLAVWMSGLAALGAIAFPVEQALVPAGSHGELRTVQPPGIVGAPRSVRLAVPGPVSGAGPLVPARPAGGQPTSRPSNAAGQAASAPTGKATAGRSDGTAAVGGAPAAGAGSAGNAPDVPTPPVPLRPGRYLYDYQVSGGSRQQAPLIVSAPTTTAHGRLQHESYTYDLGNYVVTVQWDYLYSPVGLYQAHYINDVTLNGVPYDHEDCPDSVLILPTGVHKGDTWHSTGTCTDRLNGTTTRTSTISDGGRVQLQVDGQAMTAIDLVEQWGQGDLEDPYVLPSNGLALEDQVTQSNGGWNQGSYWERVRSTNPS